MKGQAMILSQNGGKYAMNIFPEPSSDVLLFGFQASKGADKNLQVCGNHGNFDSVPGRSRIIYNMIDWSVSSILFLLW